MSVPGEKQKFKKGDKVVYPLHGLGYIDGTEKIEDEKYYRIKIEQSGLDVLIPTTSTTSGLRHLVSAEEAKKAISSLSRKKEIAGTDWKQRLLNGQDLMKDGTITSVAVVVNCLYRRQKLKDLPVQERKLYDTALSILIDEAAIVLGKTKDEISKEIFIKLEK